MSYVGTAISTLLLCCVCLLLPHWDAPGMQLAWCGMQLGAVLPIVNSGGPRIYITLL